MQPEERVAAHLWDMGESLRRLARHLAGRTEGDLFTDEMLQDAVLRQLTVLGEAAGRVGQPFRDLHPEIPWKSIVGLRNVVTHQYDRVNLDQLWIVATENAPRLLHQVESILHGLTEGDARPYESD
jgi:uncharacterized protein with HEPN domain